MEHDELTVPEKTTILEKIKANKAVIIKRTLLIGGSIAGLALTIGLLNREDDPVSDDDVEDDNLDELVIPETT